MHEKLNLHDRWADALFIIHYFRYLHIAVIRTDRFMIQALIERLKRETENGHNLMYLIDQENNRRQTPLFLAVAANDPGKVQLLIKEGGANVNTLAQVCQFKKTKYYTLLLIRLLKLSLSELTHVV